MLTWFFFHEATLSSIPSHPSVTQLPYPLCISFVFAWGKLSLIAWDCVDRNFGVLSPWLFYRERELAAVKVSKEDIELVATEMEMSKDLAERALRENKVFKIPCSRISRISLNICRVPPVSTHMLWFLSTFLSTSYFFIPCQGILRDTLVALCRS